MFGFPRRTPKVSYRCRLVGARRRAGRGTANGCGQYGQSAADTAEPDMVASVCELGRSLAPTLPSLQLPRAEFTLTRSAGRGWWSDLERWTWTRYESSCMRCRRPPIRFVTADSLSLDNMYILTLNGAKDRSGLPAQPASGVMPCGCFAACIQTSALRSYASARMRPDSPALTRPASRPRCSPRDGSRCYGKDSHPKTGSAEAP